MEPNFECPVCKIELDVNYSCIKCLKNYFVKDGTFDFSQKSKDNDELEISTLLHNIQTNGYSNAMTSFLKNTNTGLEEKFSLIEGDIVFRCINKKNIRCLVINSELGNISENLSKIFEQVFSLESNENKILIQKIRFKQNHINNVTIVRSNLLLLPFPKEYFDLVVFNGIKIKEKNNIINYFKEVNRVLKPSACLCVGALNKFRIQTPLGENKNSINLMYADSYNGYHEIFKQLKFHVRSFWIFGSFRRPFFIGDMDDELSLKWTFSNLEKILNINIKNKIFGWLLGKLNITLSKFLIKLFSSSFLFYCFKDGNTSEFEEMIIEKTGYRNFLQQIRPKNIHFILFDNFGNPKKKLICERTNDNLNEEIVCKNFATKKNFSTAKITIQDWVQGRHIDVHNIDEIELVMKWLINFQTETSTELYTLESIDNELNIIKNNLKNVPEMKNLSYQKWLNDYREYAVKLKINKTAVHGDLTPHNILFDSNTSSISVIDWELLNEHGNPFYDMIKFIFYIVTPNSSINEFRKNIRKSKKISSLVTIDKIISDYHQNKFNLIILLRFFFLHDIALNKNLDKIFFVKLLIELSTISQTSTFE